MFWYLQSLWPFSLLKPSDLRISNGLVSELSIPDHTKKFVFAFQDPESKSVIYILATQNLSEKSALDAQYLIKELQPDVVMAQISPLGLADLRSEEDNLKVKREKSVPTSSLGVLKGCFLNKINKEQYEHFAGSQVLYEIFGTGFYGHLLSAKQAAKEVDSPFVLVESPFVKISSDQTMVTNSTSKKTGLVLQTSNLMPGNVASAVSCSAKRFSLTDTHQSNMVKSVSSAMNLLMLKDDSKSDDQLGTIINKFDPKDDNQVPSFAGSIYSLLFDLHTIFNNLPIIGSALINAKKMLVHVDRGESVDSKLLTKVHNFRIAVEGLRIALNDAARIPMNQMENQNLRDMTFSELCPDDKCHALFAQSIKAQTKRFRTIVAIIDASSLSGLRKYWNTSVPQEYEELMDRCFLSYEDDQETNFTGKKKLIANKQPVVAVGAGATAVLGASSLSKAVPASTFVKLVTFKIPVSLKFGLMQLQRNFALGLSKILSSSKLVAPGFASSGTKTSAMKVTVSSEKIRAVTHSVVASVERTSLQAMRTSLYQIMRKHRGGARSIPWATFGCSVAICSGLLVYGDGIECAAESLPAATTIACLGRGLKSLHDASQMAQNMEGRKIDYSIRSLMQGLHRRKIP